MDKLRLKLKIFGDVQGVAFRYHSREMASDLDLTGWVRNAADGAVECLAEGQKEKLEKFLQWCHKGPKWADVSKVDSEWQKYQGEFDSFKIIY